MKNKKSIGELALEIRGAKNYIQILINNQKYNQDLMVQIRRLSRLKEDLSQYPIDPNSFIQRKWINTATEELEFADKLLVIAKDHLKLKIVKKDYPNHLS